MEAPYRNPDQSYVARLDSYIRANRDDTEDHLWNLREDPGYFSNCLMTLIERTAESTIMKEATEGSKTYSTAAWNDAVVTELRSAYGDIVNWDSLSKEFRNLATLRSILGDEISAGKALPQSYARSLCFLRRVIPQFIRAKSENLKLAVTRSPELTDYFTISRSTNRPSVKLIPFRMIACFGGYTK